MPVTTDLDMWPGLLAALWLRLWPEAKKGFSARVAINLPQAGESDLPVRLYAVPATRVNHWTENDIIRPPYSRSGGRAARWLIGEPDAVMAEVIAECAITNQSLDGLQRFERAADGLSELRQSATLDNAPSVLRTLELLAPSATVLAAQKLEVLAVIKNGLMDSPVETIFALANITAKKFPPRSLPSVEISDWVYRRTPETTPEAVVNLFKVFAKKPEADWWGDAIFGGLKKGMHSREKGWSRILLLSLCNIEQSILFGKLALTSRGNRK